MEKSLSTGSVARELGVTEPRLNDLVRRGKIAPPPPVVAGRRQWEPAHIREAAGLLGLAVKGQEPDREDCHAPR